MLTLLHGDNLSKSRVRLVALMDEAKQTDRTVTRLPASQLTEGELEMALGSADLFGDQPLIIIEELHSLPRSKKKDSLIAQVAASQTLEPAPDLILWEKKALTKTQLKKLPDAKTEIFKTSNQLFTWLDALGSSDKQKTLKLFHQALETEEEYFCFIMLMRQVRLLIQAKDGGKIAGPPFLQSKLKKQASAFSLEQLIELHSQLLELDYAYKRSQNLLSLAQELDLLQLKM